MGAGVYKYDIMKSTFKFEVSQQTLYSIRQLKIDSSTEEQKGEVWHVIISIVGHVVVVWFDIVM